jgi:hypothetical protein
MKSYIVVLFTLVLTGCQTEQEKRAWQQKACFSEFMKEGLPRCFQACNEGKLHNATTPEGIKACASKCAVAGDEVLASKCELRMVENTEGKLIPVDLSCSQSFVEFSTSCRWGCKLHGGLPNCESLCDKDAVWSSIEYCSVKL